MGIGEVDGRKNIRLEDVLSSVDGESVLFGVQVAADSIVEDFLELLLVEGLGVYAHLLLLIFK